MLAEAFGPWVYGALVGVALFVILLAAFTSRPRSSKHEREAEKLARRKK